MNYDDIEDGKIVSGDEGNLTPVEHLAVDANEVESIEPITDSNPPAEVIGEPESVDTLADTPPEPIAAVAVEQTQFGVEEKHNLQSSGWQRIRNLLGGSADATTRLNKLTQAIEDAPEASVNYVLRAELYMQLREYALAQADFQRAYELSDLQFAMADWGLLAQVMRDRALSGLDKVKRRLR